MASERTTCHVRAHGSNDTPGEGGRYRPPYRLGGDRRHEASWRRSSRRGALGASGFLVLVLAVFLNSTSCFVDRSGSSDARITAELSRHHVCPDDRLTLTWEYTVDGTVPCTLADPRDDCPVPGVIEIEVRPDAPAMFASRPIEVSGS